MAKNKRLKPSQPTSKKTAPNPHKQPKKPAPSQAEWKSKPKGSEAHKAQKAAALQQNQQPTIPFSKYDRMLLVGEGDLSFAASLVKSHGVRSLVATVFEKDRKELEEKYPHVGANIEIVEEWVERKESGNNGDDVEVEVDVVKSKEDAAVLAGLDNDEREALLSVQAEEGLAQFKKPREGKVLYNVDATKMGPYYDPVAKAARKGKVGVYDCIQFMFPHCGGKSTDVNRQVRYNQAPKGSIIVTLFEGQPYELWCIRNLARHAGLQVETSFKFQASAYPGYSHARTLGVLRNKQGEITEGRWKGEDRPARSYIFRRKDDILQLPTGSAKKRKMEDDDDYSDGGKD